MKEKFFQIIQGNLWPYIILVFSLLICVYTLNSIDSHVDAINEAWLLQWESSGCYIEPYVPHIEYNYWGKLDEIKNKGNNT